MNAIKAVWTNGQIQLLETVDWPEGERLLVKPAVCQEDDVMPGDNDWGGDEGSFEEWSAAVDRIEPMIWAEGEREEFEAFREKVKQYTLDAVRKKMEATPDGAKP